MRSRLRHRLTRHGRTIITTEIAVLVQLLSVGADERIRFGFGVFGALAIAVVAIVEAEAHATGADAARLAGERLARTRLGEAARAGLTALENKMPLGGTSVPEGGAPTERVRWMRDQLQQRRFAFRKGRAGEDWEWLARQMETGRRELVAAVGLIGGRLTESEDARVRVLANEMQKASAHAFAISSQLQGYDVARASAPHWGSSDHDLDVTVMTEYADFAREFAEIITELDGMAAAASADVAEHPAPKESAAGAARGVEERT